jgi:hypothetical protein
MLPSRDGRASASRRLAASPLEAAPERRPGDRAGDLAQCGVSMRRPAALSRETIWFLALFVGYLAAVGVLDLVSGSTLLAVVVTVVFFCLVMLVRPPRHWLDWLEYVVMLVVGVLWIADMLNDWALWLALLAELGLILLDRKVARG